MKSPKLEVKQVGEVGVDSGQLKSPVRYWEGKKRPNAFGGKQKMFNSKGMKVIYVEGRRKYISQEEVDNV